MDYDVIIPHRLYDDLVNSGFHAKNESGAWLLFSKSSISQDTWTEKPRQRFILRKVIPLSQEDIASSSPTHVTVNTASFVPVLEEASDMYVAGFLHGHPSGDSQFSATDDDNDSALLTASQNRNGKDAMFVSLLALKNGALLARCLDRNFKYNMCDVLLTGNTVRCFDKNKDESASDSIFDRQNRLFGNSFTNTLQKLRVLIVGAGGTGSPLAIMLARAGVKRMAIVDPDTVESTNLHRLHGLGFSDIGKPKAIALAKYIDSMGFDAEIKGICTNILQSELQDLLKSSDIIFSATDDHAGRIYLNRYAYFYETPVIDMGLASAKSVTGEILDITGRVTVLYPGTTCLLCLKVVNMVRAREEELMRLNRESYDSQEREGYISGGGDPEPAFIAMTTSVATMAVEEFTQLICNFHKVNAHNTHRLRRFHIPNEMVVEFSPEPDCQVCGSTINWGAGDVTPFLDRIA